MKLLTFALKLSVVAAATALVACSDNTETFSLGGSGVKGPVSGATVTVTNASSGATVGAACSATADDGSYTCSIPQSAQGPFKVALSGGSYCSNEKKVSECVASGGTVKSLAIPLSTIAVANSTGTLQSAPITPFTTAAVEAAGTSPANFVTAYKTIATNLRLDPNPAAAPVLASGSGGSNASDLLNAISAASASDLASIVTALKTASASGTSVTIGSTTVTIAATPDTSTVPAGGLGVVTEVNGTTGSITGSSGS